MYDLHQDILDALSATPETLAGLLDEISIEQIAYARGGDENWSILEIVCHLLDAEEFFLKRIKAMRDMENPVIIGYDQEKLAKEHNYQGAILHEALKGFDTCRQRVVAVLSKFTPGQWQLPGRHSDLGQITIFAMTIHHVSHDAIHCAQIVRQLKASR
jgi:hypothetical protein